MFSNRCLPKVFLLSLILLASCSQPLNSDTPDPIELTGQGLSATYFAGSNFDGLRVERIDRYLKFDWQASSPVRHFLSDGFSVRWEGQLRVPQSAKYRLYLDVMGQADLFIDGNRLAQGSSLLLKAGQAYELVIEYQKTQSQAAISFEWQADGKERVLVPQTSLFPKQGLATQALATGVNLLINPDFNVDTGAWQLYGTGNKTSVSPGRDGTGKALAASNWAWIQQDLPVSDIEIGQTYTLKGFAKATQPGVCSLGIAGGGVSGQTLTQTLKFSSGTWQELGLSVLIPTGTQWLAVYLSAETPTCLFDDLSLIAGDTTSPPPSPSPNEALISGGFEQSLEAWQQFGGEVVKSNQARVGDSALSVSAYAWVQQDIATLKLEPGQSYSFSAFAKAASPCQIGLVLATETAVVFSESLTFDQNTWQHKYLDLSLPADLSWAAVYIASTAQACLIDQLSLYNEPSFLDPRASWTGFEDGSTESLTVTAALDTISDVLYGDIISYGQSCSFKAALFSNLLGNTASGSIAGANVDATVELNLRHNFIAGSFRYQAGPCQGESRSFTLLRSDRDLILDAELRLLLFQNDVRPLNANLNLDANKVTLGRLLFHDKELSGNRDISCATCHPASIGTTDRLALSIGTGGTGFGPNRQLGVGRTRVPRNAPDLFNRAFTETMFWDGRVSGSAVTGFSTPAGTQLPAGLDSALAAQAMFPVLIRTEMRGNLGDRDVFGASNELAAIADGNMTATWSAIMNRLMAIPEYQSLFARAYPGVSSQSLGFQHAANAIAEYQKDAFTSLNSPFDRYLSGQDDALSLEQKEGALIFYGIGKCASCHSGALLTDDSFHNIAVPQLGPGTSPSGLDFGRSAVTGLLQDQFAFKTPSLRNVSLTAPYMHNGAITSLVDAVAHYHLIEQSLLNYDPSQLEPALRSTVKTDSETLNQILATLADEAKNLPLEGRAQSITNFLGALTDPATANLGANIPSSVPSGLPVFP